jgi:hypothetical protein
MRKLLHSFPKVCPVNQHYQLGFVIGFAVWLRAETISGKRAGFAVSSIFAVRVQVLAIVPVLTVSLSVKPADASSASSASSASTRASSASSSVHCVVFCDGIFRVRCAKNRPYVIQKF